MDEHDWMHDPECRGEGLVCRNCGVTEAEMEAMGMDRCGVSSDWIHSHIDRG